MLAEAAAEHPPRRRPRATSRSRSSTAPRSGWRRPTFALSLNHPVDLHFSYKRYLENQIREAFGFEGTPIVLKVRTRPH